MMNQSTDNRPEVAPPLRAWRQARNRSLRSLAAAVDVDPGHLSRIERGLASPSVDLLARIAKELGLKEVAHLLDPYRSNG